MSNSGAAVEESDRNNMQNTRGRIMVVTRQPFTTSSTVLPSYGEGMPRTVLEAMAVGRPIVTTDTRGCRDTVDEVVNGCLVPIRDWSALADGMEFFIKHPDLIAPMGLASRQKVERLFDVRKVNRDMMRILGLS